MTQNLSPNAYNFYNFFSVSIGGNYQSDIVPYNWTTKRKIWLLAVIYLFTIAVAVGAIIYKQHLEEKENDANPMIQELKKDFPQN